MTTINQKIWTLLQNGEESTISKIAKDLKIEESVTALYVRALFNAKYLSVETPHSKIKHNHKISLIKDTGDIAPLYNKKGILTDRNSFEEIIVTERGEAEVKQKNHINLVPILKAIISLNKEEIYKKEIVEESSLESVKLIRWIPRLIEVGVLIPTGEHYRNSPLFQVNLKKCEKLLSLVEELKSHSLAFSKIEKL